MIYSYCDRGVLLRWTTSSIGRVVVGDRGSLDESVTIVGLTAWYVGRVIADIGEIVEHSAISAASQYWFHAIVADVVCSAILGVEVQLVITVRNSSLGLGLVLGAGETVFKNLYPCYAACTESLDCPVTDTLELIEVESLVAHSLLEEAVGAFIVVTAISGVLMFETTILARALTIDARGLGFLLKFWFRAFYLEGVGALLDAGS